MCIENRPIQRSVVHIWAPYILEDSFLGTGSCCWAQGPLQLVDKADFLLLHRPPVYVPRDSKCQDLGVSPKCSGGRKHCTGGSELRDSDTLPVSVLSDSIQHFTTLWVGRGWWNCVVCRICAQSSQSSLATNTHNGQEAPRELSQCFQTHPTVSHSVGSDLGKLQSSQNLCSELSVLFGSKHLQLADSSRRLNILQSRLAVTGSVLSFWNNTQVMGPAPH
jgi:hypothetical protein